jgi:hypothetical protein
VNLSVEPELKDRMDAVKRFNAVNWSEVVHPLLEAEVVMFERSRGDQSAAIRRLPESKTRAERQQLIQGRIDGREWVENRAEYEVLKRLKKNSAAYQNAWDRPWEQLRCAVDPFGEYAHFFGDGDDDHHPYYLSAFLGGALETWDELEPEVELVDEQAHCQPALVDRGNAIAPIALAEAPETCSAHCTVPGADVRASSSPLPAPGWRDAVTFALAAIAEAPRPRADNPSPRARPKLWIVRVAAETYTTAREWLARERPIDYGS